MSLGEKQDKGASPDPATGTAAVVIQADRAAAAAGIVRRLIKAHGVPQRWMDEAVRPILSGEQDDHPEVQSFASHRLSHTADLLEALEAELAELQTDIRCAGDGDLERLIIRRDHIEATITRHRGESK